MTDSRRREAPWVRFHTLRWKDIWSPRSRWATPIDTTGTSGRPSSFDVLGQARPSGPADGQAGGSGRPPWAWRRVDGDVGFLGPAGQGGQGPEGGQAGPLVGQEAGVDGAGDGGVDGDGGDDGDVEHGGDISGAEGPAGFGDEDHPVDAEGEGHQGGQRQIAGAAHHCVALPAEVGGGGGWAGVDDGDGAAGSVEPGQGEAGGDRHGLAGEWSRGGEELGDSEGFVAEQDGRGVEGEAGGEGGGPSRSPARPGRRRG